MFIEYWRSITYFVSKLAMKIAIAEFFVRPNQTLKARAVSPVRWLPDSLGEINGCRRGSAIVQLSELLPEFSIFYFFDSHTFHVSSHQNVSWLGIVGM